MCWLKAMKLLSSCTKGVPFESSGVEATHIRFNRSWWLHWPYNSNSTLFIVSLSNLAHACPTYLWELLSQYHLEVLWHFCDIKLRSTNGMLRGRAGRAAKKVLGSLCISKLWCEKATANEFFCKVFKVACLEYLIPDVSIFKFKCRSLFNRPK